METVFVTNTRTGSFIHGTTDKVTTFCGRKATGVYGPEGVMWESEIQQADGTWSAPEMRPVIVTCEKCQQH